MSKAKVSEFVSSNNLASLPGSITRGTIIGIALAASGSLLFFILTLWNTPDIHHAVFPSLGLLTSSVCFIAIIGFFQYIGRRRANRPPRLYRLTATYVGTRNILTPAHGDPPDEDDHVVLLDPRDNEPEPDNPPPYEPPAPPPAIYDASAGRHIMRYQDYTLADVA